MDTLFELPPPQKTRLQTVMEQHGIETWDNNDPTDPRRWMAYLMPACRKLGYGLTEKSDMVEIHGKVCRLVGSAGYSGCGAIEVEAVLVVCKQNNLHVIL